MPINTQKGKKRAVSPDTLADTPESSTCGRLNLERKAKRSKKAETRICPVCQDIIPVRLLATHEIFELQRVEEICQFRPENDALLPWDQIEDDLFSAVPGPSRRSAAVRARRSFNPNQGSSTTSGKPNLLAKVSKAIKTVQRRRRERHVRLKELLKAEIDQDEVTPSTTGGDACPICQMALSGDTDCIEAHIDACLRHAMHNANAGEDDLAADGLEEYEIGGETRIRITRSVNFRGAGYDVRNPQDNDVEDDVDIDGDDTALFGEAQFTEADIVDAHHQDDDGNVDIKSEDGNVDIKSEEPPSPSLLGKHPPNNGITASHQSPPQVPNPNGPACRICLDHYTEPTVSTGCWHTCCKTCWLRCLGSTKLCPMCKRITIASELRRIYL